MTTSALSFSFSDDLIIKLFLLSNLPFTEGVIADGRKIEAKINQSKRAWCKSHALNLFI